MVAPMTLMGWAAGYAEELLASELEALADRLEQARAAALANRERTQYGPAVVTLHEIAGG
jgi:hypothetical protein